MNKHKKFAHKALSFFLSTVIIIASNTLITPNFVFATEASPTTISKNNVKKVRFSEKHPTLTKTLTCLRVAAEVVVATVGTYYGGRFILDKINPERTIDRNNIAAAKQRLKVVDRELMDLELGKTPFNAERVRELREIKLSISSRINPAYSSGINPAYSSGINPAYSSGIVRNAAFGVAGIWGTITIVKCLMDIVNTFGQLSKNIFNISQLRWASGNFVNMYKETTELLKPPPKGADKETALENFDRVFNGFYGQKEAVAKLKSHLYDIVIAKDQARWRGEKYSHCDLIYLYGPSGVGKSFISKRLPQILLTNSQALVMSSADVDNEKKETVVNQLFNSTPQYSDKMPPTKPLIKYLKNNPGGVVIFEEYDKICTPALDEIFRTAMEQGTINIDGERIDCSGTTFIFTSNEDDVSMQGFEKSDEDKLDKQSLNQGYTRVWHSKSFLNRIKKVKFHNMDSSEYADILRNHFKSCSSYWANVNNGGITLRMSDETINALAEDVSKVNQGARPIDLWIIPEIQMALGDAIKSAPNYDFYRDKTFDVVYDSDNRSLQVVESL